jgi:hypothetical protein
MINQFLLFTSSFICLILAVVSIPLIYLPVTKKEQQFWHKLNIRKWRQWATKKETEKCKDDEASKLDIVSRSRKNIAWHGVLTFTFGLLILQSKLTEILFLQYASIFLLAPSIFYFLGSIIQRQKIVVSAIRQKR